MCRLAAPSSPPCEAEEVNGEQVLHGQAGTFTCSSLQPFTEYSITINLPPNATLFSWLFRTEETGMCTEIPETKNSPELCHRWIDVLLTCQLMQSTSAPCTDMPGIRAARMLCSSGEGAVRALSTSHSRWAMPQPTVVLPRAAAHAAFAGDKPFLGSPFAACPTARSCLHPPLASAPAHGPVCDPLSVLPVPDKPEELWLDPDRGSLRWKALPSCKGEIIGYQVPGQTLTTESGAVCRQTGKCGKGTAGMSHTSQPVNIWL